MEVIEVLERVVMTYYISSSDVYFGCCLGTQFKEFIIFISNPTQWSSATDNKLISMALFYTHKGHQLVYKR